MPSSLGQSKTFLYSLQDYRQVIRAWVEAKKEARTGMTYEKLAESIRVPKSYLSRVLQGGAELSADQLFLVAKAMGLSGDDATYLRLLHEHARCGIKERAVQLETELGALRDAHLDSRRHLRADAAEQAADAVVDYYLDPLVQIVHVALTVNGVVHDLRRLASHLHVDESRIHGAVEILMRTGMVRVQVGGGLEVSNTSLHLPPDAGVYKAWRTRLRLMSLTRLDELQQDKSYSFSAVFSCDDATRHELQRRFLEFLSEAQKLSEASSGTRLCQMNFDLFEWF